jgi:protein pelota
MRLLGRVIDDQGYGHINVIMDENDDMWHAYNLISRGDAVKTLTFRKIKEESKTGSVVNTKKKINLLLKIQTIDYEPDGPSLRVSGVSASENKFMQLGQHHTISLVLKQSFMIYKKCWDELHLERLQMACDPAVSCEIAAIVIEQGLAHICLVTNTSAIVKSRVESHIPRKLKGASGHDKATEKFFEKCVVSITQHLNFNTIKSFLIAGPGFTKDLFLQYLEVQKPPWFSIEKIILAHASSGEKIALNDTLSDPIVKQKLNNLKFTQDMDSIEEFFLVLSKEPNRAVYCLKDVETSAKQQAISALFISDSTLRKHRPLDRQKIIEIIKSVKENGGTVNTLSSLHIAGERLNQLSGIAALLRFPVYDLEENQLSSEDEAEIEYLEINDLEDPGQIEDEVI